MTVIQINNLTKNFGKFKALDNVNFEVNKGEVHGFIGPNGAGKTTTIRILLGIYKASKGGATLFGLDAWKNAVEIHKKIAYVPGDVNLWGNLSGGEVIDLFLKLNGSINNERKEKYIRRFDLDVTKKCSTYSKGNRQKVALVAAFASDAELYIFDEPTSGLDPIMENVFQECVFEEKKAGKSILLSSHILSEVEKLCDRVSIIRKGRIIESGSLADFRHLTRTTIILTTKKQVSDLNELKGVHNVNVEDNQISLQADTDKIGEIITYLTEFEIESLEVTPLALEDLFQVYYQNEEERNNGKTV